MATFYSIALPILITIHILVCLLMVFVVLMQRPRSEGLGAAFGGGMTDSLFGAQTTNVLAKFTVWLGVGFFILTLLLAVVYAKSSVAKSAISQELLAAPAVPAASPVAAPSATPAVAEPAAVVPEATPAAAVEAPAASVPPVSVPAPTPVASPAP